MSKNLGKNKVKINYVKVTITAVAILALGWTIASAIPSSPNYNKVVYKTSINKQMPSKLTFNTGFEKVDRRSRGQKSVDGARKHLNGN